MLGKHPAPSRVCPALPQRRVAPVQQRSALLRQGYGPDEVEEALSFHIALMDYAVDGTGYPALLEAFDSLRDRRWMERYGLRRIPPRDAPYWRRFRAGLTVDPAEYYDRLRIPILAVLGELDERIAVDEHREAFLASARRSGNPDFVVEVMPRANHGLLEVRTGPDGEGVALDRFAPRFHTLVSEWIAGHFLEGS